MSLYDYVSTHSERVYIASAAELKAFLLRLAKTESEALERHQGHVLNEIDYLRPLVRAGQLGCQRVGGMLGYYETMLRALEGEKEMLDKAVLHVSQVTRQLEATDYMADLCDLATTYFGIHPELPFAVMGY